MGGGGDKKAYQENHQIFHHSVVGSYITVLITRYGVRPIDDDDDGDDDKDDTDNDEAELE